MNPLSMMGSVISSQALSRISSMVSSRSSGTILFGGERMTGKSSLDGYDLSQGNFYSPTVISEISTEDPLWHDEIFGPVVVVKSFKVRFWLKNHAQYIRFLTMRRMILRECVSQTRVYMVSQFPIHSKSTFSIVMLQGSGQGFGRQIYLKPTELPLR